MQTIPGAARALGLALVVATAAASHAAPTQTAFDRNAQLQDTPLVLNGAGTRTRVMFQVYDMALYLPRKASTAEAALSMPGPKRLSFVALREIPGTDLGLAFIKGLQANSTREQVQRHTPSSTRLIEIFSGKSRLLPGERFAMDYVPGKGTQFFIQGQPQGAPVGDAEYFEMVLRIWLGPSAVEPLLRDALLGQDGTAGRR